MSFGYSGGERAAGKAQTDEEPMIGPKPASAAERKAQAAAEAKERSDRILEEERAKDKAWRQAVLMVSIDFQHLPMRLLNVIESAAESAWGVSCRQDAECFERQEPSPAPCTEWPPSCGSVGRGRVKLRSGDCEPALELLPYRALQSIMA